MKILVAEPMAAAGLEVLRSQPGWEVIASNPKEYLDHLGDADALVVRSAVKVTKQVLEKAPKLRVIGRAGVGVDNVDIPAATAAGVLVMNTPGGNAVSVAEHTLALMLTLARRIPRLDREMRQGQWPRELLTQLLGKTVGVFGIGTIGARVVALTKAIGMHPLTWSLRGESERAAALGARAASKEEILREADVVTLHLRLVPETRGFLGRRELSMMKRTALLVNTARGALVEREALLDALTQGKIAGAALDVFHDEPLKAGDPLFDLDTVVLSPHNAGQTPEVIRDGLMRAVQNVENFLAGQPTDVVVAPIK